MTCKVDYNHIFKHISSKCIIVNANDWLDGLRQKKKQWAATYTWNYFKYGIDSTARAESINAYIKQHCNKKMTGKDLLEALDLFESRIEKQTIIETERILYHHYIKDNIPIRIKELKNTIGPFAFRALCLQVSQMENYKWVKSDVEDTYIVERFVESNNASMPEFGINEQDLCLSASIQRNLEISSGTVTLCGYRKHRTSLQSCSCQYNLSWGLPCRHMLRIHSVHNWQRFRELKSVIISDNWCLNEDVDNEEPHNVSVSQGTCLEVETKEDRASKILSLAKTLSDEVCNSSVKSQEVIIALTSLIEKYTGREDLSTSNIVPNPELKQSQNKHRYQPGDVYAPTNKTAKRAASKHRRDEANKKKKEKSNMCALL